MEKKRIGQLVFWGAMALAATLYGLTAPAGLPWNSSTHLALAYLGKVVRPPELPHPIWGCYVQVFGGAVALSAFLAALSAGLIGAMVNRAAGWRFALAAALVWIFLPGVWDRAITGQRSICLVAMAVVAVWMVRTMVLRIVGIWRTNRGALGNRAQPNGMTAQEKFPKIHRISGWVAIGAAVVFALVSATFHDYQMGEAASAFVRGVAAAAGERIIVANGLCDGYFTSPSLSLRTDDAYRAKLVEWVRTTFPGETNFVVAATVSPQTFVEVATKKFPERFYLMDGTSTTLEQWECRWEAFKPYLKSSDPFVPVARRLFAYEGNALANSLGNSITTTSTTTNNYATTSWRLYQRICTEIDPGNFSALVNMSEMIRRGYVVSDDERQRVQLALDKVLVSEPDLERLRRLARAAGPVRTDAAQLEKLRAEMKARIATRIAAGEKVEIGTEILTLIEWNNEMVRLMNQGEIVSAGRIARVILANPKWREFIPANAVMGSVTAREGDYTASAEFFRVATAVTNAVPVVVLNDYADVLMRLDKLDEAEKLARRAVEASDEDLWVTRLTLAQILRRKEQQLGGRKKGDSSIKALLKFVLKRAPAAEQARIRREFWDYSL